MDTPLHIQVSDGIGEILLNRPPVNGLTPELLDALLSALRFRLAGGWHHGHYPRAKSGIRNRFRYAPGAMPVLRLNRRLKKAGSS